MFIKGERLREMRERQGISQRELARQCNISDVLVYRYENGISDPSTKHLIALAAKLDASIDYLTGLSDNPHGQIGDQALNADEEVMLKTYRREGWRGVARLSIERI